MTDNVTPQQKPSVYYDDEAGVWVYRASAIARCATELIYWRMGLEGEPAPEGMQRRFDDGHLHEPAILAEVTKQTGWKPVTNWGAEEGGQWAIEIPVMDGVVIRGHLDGIFGNPNFSGLRVVEAKALSKDMTDAWLKRSWDAFPYYRDQLTVYMHGAEVNEAIFAVKNKNSSQVHVTMVDEPPGDIDEILRRIMVIEGKARAGIIPDQCDRRSYPCPFYRLHDDEDIDEVGSQIASADAGRMDQLLADYAIARDDEKDAKERKEAARDQILELLGDPDAVYEGTVWVAKQDRKTRKRVDHARMRRDGIDVDYYTDESYYYAINVVRKKGIT